MSFQAYLDTIERKTGMTPQALLDVAHARGFGLTSRAGEVATWLKEEHELGRGHAMAFFHVLTKGPTISATHVGSDGVHRDESTELRLDGIARR